MLEQDLESDRYVGVAVYQQHNHTAFAGRVRGRRGVGYGGHQRFPFVSASDVTFSFSTRVHGSRAYLAISGKFVRLTMPFGCT